MKCTSRGKSGEVKNEYLLRKRLHTSWVPGPRKKNKKKTKRNYDKQLKICVEDQTSEEGVEGEEREGASAGVFGSPE